MSGFDVNKRLWKNQQLYEEFQFWEHLHFKKHLPKTNLNQRFTLILQIN